jgi:hypothetical protein
VRRAPDTTAAVKFLAVISVALAAMCIFLVVAWKREHTRVDCWRAYAEDGAPPPEGDCRRL